MQTLEVFDKIFLFGDKKYLGDSENNYDSVDHGWRNSKDQKYIGFRPKEFGPLIEARISRTDTGILINLVVRELTTNCLYIFNEVGGKILWIENCYYRKKIVDRMGFMVRKQNAWNGDVNASVILEDSRAENDWLWQVQESKRKRVGDIGSKIMLEVKGKDDKSKFCQLLYFSFILFCSISIKTLL